MANEQTAGNRPFMPLLRSARFVPLFAALTLGLFNISLCLSLVSFRPGAMAFAAGVAICALGFLWHRPSERIAPDGTRLVRWAKGFEFVAFGIVILDVTAGDVLLPVVGCVLLGIGFALDMIGGRACLAQRLRDSEQLAGSSLMLTGAAFAICLGVALVQAFAGLNVALTGLFVGGSVAALVGWFGLRAAPIGMGNNGETTHPDPLSDVWDCLRFRSLERARWAALCGIAWLVLSLTVAVVYLDAIPTQLSLVAGIACGSLLCRAVSGRYLDLGAVPFAALGLAFSMALLASASGPIEGSLLVLFIMGLFAGALALPLCLLTRWRSSPMLVARMTSCGLLVGIGSLIAGILVSEKISSTGVPASDVWFVMTIGFVVVAGFAYSRSPHLALRFLTWLLIHSFYRVDKRGFENIPATGPAVLVFNHVSFVDSVLLMAAIRRPIRFVMDHRIHSTPVVGFLFRHSRTIPIATAKEDPAMKESAFVEVAKALANGELIGLFPEGRITHTGEINHFRYGVGRIVSETPVPVVPMALRGLWGSFFSRRHGPAMSKPSVLRWLAKVEIVVGEAVPPELGTPEYLQEIVTTLRGGIV